MLSGGRGSCHRVCSTVIGHVAGSVQDREDLNYG